MPRELLECVKSRSVGTLPNIRNHSGMSGQRTDYEMDDKHDIDDIHDVDDKHDIDDKSDVDDSVSLKYK